MEIIISLMIHNSSRDSQVEEASLKAGGAKEDVVEALGRIRDMITKNATLVVKKGISLMTNLRRKMTTKGKGSRTIMHLLVRM